MEITLTAELEIHTVPRNLYYHEVAYVRGLEADNERLKAALKPFADVAGEWDGEDISLEVELRAYDRLGPGISVADFREARRALEPKP